MNTQEFGGRQEDSQLRENLGIRIWKQERKHEINCRSLSFKYARLSHDFLVRPRVRQWKGEEVIRLDRGQIIERRLFLGGLSDIAAK